MTKKIPAKYNILVTAGPTVEPIDPVRYLSNFSTGTMGYAVAEEAAKKGYKVCLVTGPVSLSAPDGVEIVRVNTALEMQRAVLKGSKKADCIVMTAAVCDFRPRQERKSKIKKKGKLSLELVENPDILKGLKNRKDLLKVGFALETENVIKNAKKKIGKKGIDILVANRKTPGKTPFGGGKKDFIFLDGKGKIDKKKNITKKQCARKLLKKIEEILG